MWFKVLAVAAAAVWLDGGVFYSPYVVPVAGCMMVLGIVAASIWAGVRSQEIRSHERLARIAQGLPVEPEWQEKAVHTHGSMGGAPVGHGPSRPNDGSRARRAGVVLVSVGGGLIAFFFALTVVTRTPEVLSGGAAALIPLAIGIGFLVDARAKRRDFEQFYYQAAIHAPNVWANAGAVPPPPPSGSPAGLTPAQASDWQPSSTLK